MHRLLLFLRLLHMPELGRPAKLPAINNFSKRGSKVCFCGADAASMLPQITLLAGSMEAASASHSAVLAANVSSSVLTAAALHAEALPLDSGTHDSTHDSTT